MAQSVMDAELSDLEGIGPATKEKLLEAGIESVLDLASALPGELVDRASLTTEKASAMIYIAQRKLTESGLIDRDFVPAIEVLEKRLKMLKCSTGSLNLDKLSAVFFCGTADSTACMCSLMASLGCFPRWN
jgi:DNA repair protein RadA